MKAAALEAARAVGVGPDSCIALGAALASARSRALISAALGGTRVPLLFVALGPSRHAVLPSGSCPVVAPGVTKPYARHRSDSPPIGCGPLRFRTSRVRLGWMRRRLVPALLIPALALSVALLPRSAAQPPSAHIAAACGVERWPVKTLSDPREKLVNYKPHDSSIGRLRKKPHPHVGPNTKRIKGVETTNYRVAARLVEMKLEDDRDIHLVVSVPSAPAKTMIVEFPDTTCNGASSSPKKAKMASARSRSSRPAVSPPPATSPTSVAGRPSPGSASSTSRTARPESRRTRSSCTRS